MPSSRAKRPASVHNGARRVQLPTKSTETAQGYPARETLVEVQANKSTKPDPSRSDEAEGRGDAGVRLRRHPVEAAAPMHQPVNTGSPMGHSCPGLESKMVEAKSRYPEEHVRVRSLASKIVAGSERGSAFKGIPAASSLDRQIPSRPETRVRRDGSRPASLPSSH